MDFWVVALSAPEEHSLRLVVSLLSNIPLKTFVTLFEREQNDRRKEQLSTELMQLLMVG